ncbi:hydantoinase B/oxoprolinase family protein [Hoeflea sp. WL0058]|uniref:Hydantoinase B/oxoprolinase family protein n=1 Tax=Flavimaribacter sediminis TaxID=2865987 RepID=A0AAE3D1F1_9HYPH|nr:hydantoinase B/oxoprolinase family protein [Flavimaribacter sediminis]
MRNGLIAASEEMKTVLMRTAYNMIIYEALDFTVGLFDARGQTLSISLGLPMFIRGMGDTVRAKVEHFGPENIQPGDVLLTNDAYITGSHLNHPTFSQPIFHEGRLVAFASCMAHWIDIGGVLSGVTTDIFSEGLQIPVVKYYKAGQLNQDLHDLIRMNVRMPERAMGDLQAQLASIRAGARQFEALMNRYGGDAVMASIDAILDQSEAAAREQLRQIPDGVYEAESFMDDDAIEIGKPVPLQVRVEVSGDTMTVDLSNVSPQVRGFYNTGAGEACAQVAFKCLAASQEYPINDGTYRPLKVINPKGTVLNARRPAPMRLWMTYPMTVIDTIFKALAPTLPDSVIAGHHADLMVANVNGKDPETEDIFLYLGGLIGGGWGAKSQEDGVNATICINDGDTHNGPVEQVENKYPLIIRKYALREDSGGAGEFRGGLGTVQECEALAPINFQTRIERVNNPPHGLFGGMPGMGNQVAVRRSNGEETVFPNGKLTDQLEAGEAYILRSGGGGGFGPPGKRNPASIRHDIVQGYVSAEAAKCDYGFTMEAED